MITALKTLIIALLFLLPLGELVRFDLENNIALKPLDIVCGAVFIVWLFRFIYEKQYKQPIARYVKIFAIFPLIGLVSLLINSTWLKPVELIVAFFYLFRLVAYTSVLFVVTQFDDKFKKVILRLLVFDGLIFLFLGYVQYFFYNNLKNLYYLGWDEHMHRMFSTFLDPNFAGSFLVLYLLFLSGLIWSEIKKGTHKLSSPFNIIFVFTLLAIFLTYSRGAILMLLVGFVTTAILIKRKKIIFLLLGAVVLFTIFSAPKFNVENVNLFRTNSIIGRINNYSMAITIFQDRPLLGVGFNTYRYAKHLYGYREAELASSSHADAGVDNSYLFVLVTTGIAGFLAYVWMWVTIIKNTIRQYKKKLTVFPLIVIVSCMSLFVNALFINSLFFPAIMLWMWTLIGLGIKDK